MKPLPQLIALCGHPTSGKSTAAECLQGLEGYHLVDDGKPLREIAKSYFGLTHDQVYTQAGKLEEVELNGRTWTVREILGELGNAFEEKFGGDIIPIMSHNSLPVGQLSVFGSVRREQGAYWRKHGALVIEIVNPLAGPSPYAFDRYNPAHCHYSIINEPPAGGFAANPVTARAELGIKLAHVLREWRLGRLS
ncbi:MAG: hypothetical protein DI537_13875 [Stutzerimonas stutzeri]|nr:MAG: hypothetical protein DI537_13875 [Stutzerimonas stutzeri]